MKTKLISILAVAAAALSAMCSCSDDTWEPKTEKSGEISLSSIGIEVSSAMDVVSRNTYDLSSFIVKVYDEQNTMVQKWTYGEMPEIFTLKVGNYRVDVESHEIQKAAWDEPYYFGSKEFAIEDSKITEIGVVKCSFASLKVSIVFSDDLREVMGDDVKVTVVANDDGTLVFTPSETRAGYFAVVEGSTTLAARFQGTVMGYAEDINKVYEDIAPGQHRIITFSLKGVDPNIDVPAGTIDPSEGINVDVSVTDENINGGINPEEGNKDSSDRPGNENFGSDTPDNPDQPDQPDTPTEEAATFESELSFDTPNDPNAGVSGLVTIKIPKGCAHLIVAITTTSANFAAAIEQIGIQQFDLCYPGAQEAGLQSLGLLTGSDVIGKTEVPFDISEFIPLLTAFPGTHNFQISVTDQENKQTSKTLTFVAE